MSPRQKVLIAVIGASRPSARALPMAETVGRLIAERGAVLVCGGLGGVMEAAARGAFAAGGDVLGILPGPSRREANAYVTLPVATNMGHARNIIIAQTADALIAVEGEYGTLAEAAIGCKLGKPVIVLPGGPEITGCRPAEDPQTAVNLAFESLDYDTKS
ncbi:MAG: TIGR00725 family protein [Desulfuromonadales bacterium]|jgi:uncharacterized protein (TIGR00725 family)